VETISSNRDRATSLQKLLIYMVKVFESEINEALVEFWGEYFELKNELASQWKNHSEAAFNLWFAFDRALQDGSFVVDNFLEDSKYNRKLSSGERDFLLSLKMTSMHLYEVVDLVPGVSVTFLDLIDGGKVTVQERTGSRNMCRYEWYAVRINSRGPSRGFEMESGLMQITRMTRDFLFSKVKTQRTRSLDKQPEDIEKFYKNLPILFHMTWVGSLLESPILNYPSSNYKEALPNSIPLEINEALILENQSKYYRKWLDESIPALDGYSPREVAKKGLENEGLRDKLFDLIHQLEGAYEQALKNAEPAYDPSWMWADLGLAKTEEPFPLLLAHERVDKFAPGAIQICSEIAEQFRQDSKFDDKSSLLSQVDINENHNIKKFITDKNYWLKLHFHYMLNYFLHRRKTFWVNEALSYMLGQTDVDVDGRDLRSPFVSFALVFTDRNVLSKAERLLSLDKNSPLAGHLLKVVTVYVTEENIASGRVFRLSYALDALGADPPSLMTYEILINEDLPVESNLDSVAPKIQIDDAIAKPSALRELVRVTFNAILYATSAGVEPEIIQSTRGHQGSPGGASRENKKYSSEKVFFLSGAIDISHVRRVQDLERVYSGRPMVKKFMVRGHWRRASIKWNDQRMRWIQPHWKGPDIAAVIERAYRLKP
jgi:hypothetical protein